MSFNSSWVTTLSSFNTATSCPLSKDREMVLVATVSPISISAKIPILRILVSDGVGAKDSMRIIRVYLSKLFTTSSSDASKSKVKSS